MNYLKTLLVLIIFGAAFVACEKNEVSYAFQEISAPTNVEAVFDIAQDDSGLVTITPSGEGAQSFNVYYGDVANLTFHSDFHLKFGEDLVVVNDQITLLFVKTSDGWKMVHEHHSPLKKEEN